ncbi:RidA family protein [Phototrophicus methaneseepsis]|uniref:RidA family protein n=1 Tax=Phototrophicus methaneseepsis TaxID=2710758 RepID=A0A7S8E969_9CHLR|nr:RidA family protein [Phototrophicus methaneseepsis]QPC82686.1 RidA family protein [Phototrophicus methaneseepsis]
MKTVIRTEKAPGSAGPYSQAIIANGFIFTAGQVALDPATNTLVEGGIQEQTRQVLNNIKTVLEAAGSDLEHVVKATVFLADIGDFQAMNEVYTTFFPVDPPARSAFQVGHLPLDAMIEIETIALPKED